MFISGIRGKSPVAYPKSPSAGGGGGGGGDIWVADIAAIEALPDADYPNGQQATPYTILQSFQLVKNSTATIDGITVVATLSGVGRWIRIETPVAQWTEQFTWFVDTAAGLDENTGTSTATPATHGVGALKTLAEVCRRMVAALFPPTAPVAPNTVSGYVVNVNGAIATSDSFDWNPRIVNASDGAVVTPQNTQCFVTVQATLGALVPVVCGAFTAGTTPATNTQAILGGAGAGGPNPVPVGSIVQVTAAANPAMVGYQAVVLKSLGVDARVSNWWLPGTAPYSGNGTPATIAPAALSSPAPGDSYAVLPLVAYNGMARGAANTVPFIQVFKNFLFTATANIFAQNMILEPLSCGYQGPLSLANSPSSGQSSNATIRWFGCALMPSDNTYVTADERTRFIMGGIINTTAAAQNTGRIEIMGVVVQGGPLGGGIHAGRGVVGFKADTSQNNGQLAVFFQGNTFGLGIFDTPAAGGAGNTSDGNGLGAYRQGTVSIDAPLYGSGNNVGTDCDEGGTIIVRSTITPTLVATAGANDLLFAGDGGTSIPAPTGNPATFPVSAALTSWATWQANFGGAGTSNVISYKNGSKIIVAANPD